MAARNLEIGRMVKGKAQVSFAELVTGWQVIRPIRALVFAADYLVWQSNPVGYHLTNFLFHLTTTLVVS